MLACTVERTSSHLWHSRHYRFYASAAITLPFSSTSRASTEFLVVAHRGLLDIKCMCVMAPAQRMLEEDGQQVRHINRGFS